jgi:hypothetical protein
MSSIKNINSKFDLISSRIKYGTDGGINVDGNALFVNGLNGRVGINTISPQTNLDISGSLVTRGINTLGSVDISGYYDVNGVPINNSFYPALSIPTTEKAVASWTAGNNSTGSSWNSIAWSPQLKLFAMVRQGGALINKIVTSSNGGISWTDRKTSIKAYQGIVWCNDLSGVGMFVSTQGNGLEFTISTDGVTWNDISTPMTSVLTVGFGAIAYAPSLRRVVAVSYNQGYAYSDDGYNWTAVVGTNGSSNFYNLTWSEDLKLFAAIGSGSTPIQVSPNGINWTSIAPSSPISITNGGIVWSPQLGRFCGAGDGFVVISSDGYNWTTYTRSNMPYRNLSWSPELRIFLGGTSASVSYSYDGINWFTKNVGLNGAKSSIWCPELGYFLVAGDMFPAYRSYFTGRPPTSYNVFDSSLNNISQLGLWNYQSFGRGIPVTKTTDFTIQPGENWIICNGTSTITITLPTASTWTGREIMMKNLSTTQAVNSASSNVVPISSTTPGTTIFSAAAGSAKWAVLISDGTNWIVMDSN